MQQSYARVVGVTEVVQASELLEDALRMHSLGSEANRSPVIREFTNVPPITVDRHKVVQILVSLLKNARQACESLPEAERRISVRIGAVGPDRIKIEVADNGVGIAQENLMCIFAHGFSTRPNGHGFGLHSAALAAAEMGGTLSAKSGGPGHGAIFCLELPLKPKPGSERGRAREDWSLIGDDE